MSGFLNDSVLGIFAESLDDIEKVRCANENRLRQLTDTTEHGHGLTLEHASIARAAQTLAAMNCDSDVLKGLGWQRPPKERGKSCCLEHTAINNLEYAMKNHPLGPWVKAQTGVGFKQAARLLAVIGDPYWMTTYKEVDGEVICDRDGPRTVSQLWAYCGLHVVNYQAPRRKRGEKGNWNEDGRKRIWLISASCIKQKPEASQYRLLYDQAREKYADAKHNEECLRCGPKGKPAQPGSLLSAGHQHARGMRLMSKAILKDLWIEAKRIHEAS